MAIFFNPSITVLRLKKSAPKYRFQVLFRHDIIKIYILNEKRDPCGSLFSCYLPRVATITAFMV